MTIRTLIVAAIVSLGITSTGLGERGGAFSIEQKLTASDGAAEDYFGLNVAISGDTALVGAYGDDEYGTYSGSAYIYQRQADGSWSEIQKLTASDGAAEDYFGLNVSISGDTALVGAYGDDDNGTLSGSAYIFERDDNDSWSQIQKLTASDGEAEDYFGYSVSISGETVLVGAYGSYGNTFNSGSAYIYERLGNWSERAKLINSNGTGNDHLGFSVAISGETAIVGAFHNDDQGFFSGTAYIYQRQASGSWGKEMPILASDGTHHDYFGYSVAISGETALVGAYGDDDNGTDSGSAYIYGPPAPPGACCVHTGCEILTLEQCSNLGGVFMANEYCEECDPVCFADINGDGTVDVYDLLALIGAWGTCP